MRRIISLLIALLMLSIPGVWAAEQTGSLSVGMTYGGHPVPGGSVRLYRVAALGADWQYVTTPEFSGCGVDCNGSLSPADAITLAEYAGENGLSGQIRELGSQGSACFSPLEAGLYLLVQEEAGLGYLPVKPFIVGVPQQVGGVLQYQVDASPKCTPEPGAPQIPQTGQLGWSVPVMAGLGLIFLAGGLLLYRRKPDA